MPPRGKIASGIKHIWESEMGSPSSARIIEDVDRALDALKVVYCAHGAAVEGLHIGMDTDDRWWVMGKVGGGGGREVKVRDASAILNGR